jgi:hypothetical protein
MITKYMRLNMNFSIIDFEMFFRLYSFYLFLHGIGFGFTWLFYYLMNDYNSPMYTFK